jgi:hypothetical protein
MEVGLEPNAKAPSPQAVAKVPVALPTGTNEGDWSGSPQLALSAWAGPDGTVDMATLSASALADSKRC